MSTQYPGGFITKSPVAPTSSAASGIWTVDQALQYVKAGTWPSPPIFIEDLFSTYLFTGNALASQTITNNIDVSGKGGLVWIKSRNVTGSDGNYLQDTARGATSTLVSNSTAAATSGVLSSFTSSGFVQIAGWGTSDLLASWTFPKQPKFFDIVTYTGNNSTGGQTINHNLGSIPGCIIYKAISGTSAVTDWEVYHTSLGSDDVTLNTTNAAQANGFWNTTPTATTFKTAFGVAGRDVTNASGTTYVAYLFASNAGGFPASGSGSTNGITCGSYTGNDTTNNISLGYEPQFVIIKRTSGVGNWQTMDTMRGMNMSSVYYLYPNLDNAETSNTPTWLNPTATGFTVTGSSNNYNGSGNTYIYIAIRRGPMKTPTVGTSVFSPVTGTTSADFGFPSDFVIFKNRSGTSGQPFFTRLLDYKYTNSATAFAEAGGSGDAVWNGSQTTFSQALTSASSIYEGFGRAPSFMDVVCYTGTGANTTQTHNLGVAPEMMIVKKRSATADWEVYHSALGPTKVIELNLTGSESTSSTRWNDTAPTASVFTIGTHTTVNASGATYVAYLFATLAGVSKVGSFTGTAALQTINCGFTTGARFVLIKRSDAGSTGDWYVWDSARGISSSTDPYLLLNSTAAEVTGTNYVDTDTTGFKVTAAASTTVNISAATYIFLAIA